MRSPLVCLVLEEAPDLMVSVPRGREHGHSKCYQGTTWAQKQDAISVGVPQSSPERRHNDTDAQVYKSIDLVALHLKADHQTEVTGRVLRMEEKGTDRGVAAMAACYQRFDPAAYLQYNYTPPRADFERKDSIVPWKLACLHRAFTEGDVNGELLVDIGSGPTLYQVLSGCEVFNQVLLTDFLEINRQELRHWLRDEGACSLDWTPYLQHVCKLEGRRPSAWTEKAAKLRQVITDILPIDVHRPQPLASDVLPSEGADCLVSCFCLESVSPDLPAFNRALGHIGRLLRPGGHLLLIGALGESYYFGGPGVKIPVVPLSEAQVCASLRESGYTLIRLEVYTLPQDMRVGVDDVSGVFFVKARKD